MWSMLLPASLAEDSRANVVMILGIEVQMWQWHSLNIEWLGIGVLMWQWYSLHWLVWE